MVRFRGVEIAAGGWPFLQVLRKPAWSQPFFLFAALDIFLWLGVAMFGFQTATIVATGFAILLALLATLWSDGGLVYGSLLLTILGSGAGLMWAGLTLIQTLAALGGVSVILYAVARILEWALPESGVSSLWSWSLTRTAICLSVIAVVGTLPSVASQTPATASALASAGALYLAIAYRGRYFSLGYLAAAMVQIAWVLVLLFQSVKQPQLYAIPVGIYFTVIGLLERRREREHFANYLEGFGLAILLLTSFIQSLDPNGGFPYFLLMLLEALLTIAWGALRRIKVPFFTGIFATVLNIVAQLVLVAVVNDVMRWVVTLGGGCLVFILGLLAERLRATGQIREWRSSLEDWS